MTRKRIPDPEPEPGTVELTIPNYGLIARLRRKIADRYMTEKGLTGSAAMHEAVKVVANSYIHPPIAGDQLASWLAANAAAYGYFRRKKTDAETRRRGDTETVTASPLLPFVNPVPVSPPPKPLLGQPNHATTAEQLIRNAVALAPGRICILPPMEVLAHLLGVDHAQMIAIVRNLDQDGYDIEMVNLEPDGAMRTYGDGACIGYRISPAEHPLIAAYERQIALIRGQLDALETQVAELRRPTP